MSAIPTIADLARAAKAAGFGVDTDGVVQQTAFLDAAGVPQLLDELGRLRDGRDETVAALEHRIAGMEELLSVTEASLSAVGGCVEQIKGGISERPRGVPFHGVVLVNGEPTGIAA